MALLVAIQGCMTTICGGAIFLPFVLYTGMFWNKMNKFSKMFYLSLILFVISIGIIEAIQAINKLT